MFRLRLRPIRFSFNIVEVRTSVTNFPILPVSFLVDEDPFDCPAASQIVVKINAANKMDFSNTMVNKLAVTKRTMNCDNAQTQLTKGFISFTKDRKSTRLNSSHSQISYAV